MSADENKNTTLKNVFAILGFIILLIIGIWSAIQVIKFVPRLFSDTGTTTQPINDNGIVLGNRDIAVELSKSTVQSGEPVTITWAHKGDETGVLSFSYACKEGFYFQIAGNPVACNGPYSIPVRTSSLEIIPLSAKTQVEVPFALTYTNAAEVSVRDTKTLTVLNDSIIQEDGTTTPGKEGTVATPVEPVAQTPTTTTPPRTTTPVVTPKPIVRTIRVPRASDPYGTADLKVEMVAIGDINPYGSFTPKSIVHPYARGAVKFKVTNIGTKATGGWYFNAVLPTQGGYPFASQPQPSLNPGSSTEIFMTFDQLTPGVHTFSVHVDPLNQILEWSEVNNTTGQTITVLSY